MASLIGTKANQVPTCGDLGKLAFMDVVDTVSNNPYYDTAISDVQPTLNLDFVNSKTLDPRITFTRSTTATYYDAKSSAVAEQNMLLQSQTFNTTWTAGNVTLTANSTTAPDGTTTAYTMATTTATGGHGVYVTKTAGSGNTYSVYAKAGTSNYVGLTGNGTTSFSASACATFNLSTGTVSSSSNCTASIVSVGNGWYRCIVANQTISTDYFIVAALESDFGPSFSPWNTYTGTGLYSYIWGAQLEQRSSATAYTPTTTTAITNYIPTLQTAVANQARLDYNPITRVPNGLLIEESRTNLFTYSSAFDNAAWAKGNGSITTAANIAPDGTQTGELLVESTATGQHYITQSPVTTAISYTYSVYAKAAGRTLCTLYLNGTTTTFDLASGNVTNGSGVITFVGNGWYRCSMTATGGASSSLCVIYLVTTGTTNNYTGDGYKGIYLWGAQLEAGSFATSYIPTVASQVTRSADAASMTGTNFSSWYNPSAISLYSQFRRMTTGVNNQAVFQFNTSGDFISVYTGNSGTQDLLYGNAVGITGAVNTNLGTATTSSKKIALSYVAGYLQGAYNNTNITSVAPVNVPSNQTVLNIGWNGASNQLNGWIQKLQYFPLALPSAELQELTA